MVKNIDHCLIDLYWKTLNQYEWNSFEEKNTITLELYKNVCPEDKRNLQVPQHFRTIEVGG